MASPNPFLASAAVFDYAGPPVTLVKQLKYGRHAFLAQSMGALMAAQLIELGWPLPDILIPVPMSATHYLGRGFNQSELLATQLGTMINRPTHSALGRLSGDYSQAGLTKFQRATLSKKRMQLLLSNELKGKTLLVIDDVMTTGQTLRCCAEILQQALPKAVYALTFCLAR